jgi:hypothetical protein
VQIIAGIDVVDQRLPVFGVILWAVSLARRAAAGDEIAKIADAQFGNVALELLRFISENISADHHMGRPSHRRRTSYTA